MFDGPRYSSSPVRVIAAASPHRPSVAWSAWFTPRRQDTLAQIEAGFGISVRTVCTHDVCHLPARRPSRSAARPARSQAGLRAAGRHRRGVRPHRRQPGRPPDGSATPSAWGERAGADRSDQAGRLLWISPVLPGRVQALTAVHTHRVIRICERQGIRSSLPRLTGRQPPRDNISPTPARRQPNAQPTSLSRRCRAPVKPGVARLKSGPTFRKATIQPASHVVHHRSRPHPEWQR